MLKNVLFFLASLATAVLAAFGVHHWLSRHQDPGYVLIGWGHWSLETSLVVFAVAQIVLFFLCYLFFRGVGWLLRLPGKIKARQQALRHHRSQDALIAGLIDSAEGNWEKAEKMLIRHASHSGAPLIHYLTAARAAQSRGALEKRDEYLKAAEVIPGSELAVGLTQAELHLSEKQFDQAIETLTKLHSIAPGHASVLKLLHQAYHHLGDWQAMRRLLPSLHQHKVLLEAEVKLLETQVFSELLKQAAADGDAEQAQALWAEVPEHIRSVPGMRAIYFAVMIETGAGAKIEQELVEALKNDWNETLLELYGSVPSQDPANQLKLAEQWLTVYSQDATLLRVLGRLCLRQQIWDRAEHYLMRSLDIEPSVAACQLLGEWCMQQGDKDRACECYKRALELASSQVERYAENISR